jgi:ketosteroid isomerase-like protein
MTHQRGTLATRAWQHAAMSTETTRTLIEDFYTALRTGDRPRLVELLAPDAVWIPPASGPIPRMEGAEAVAEALGGQVVRQTFDLSKPFGLEIRRTIADGDVARVLLGVRASRRAHRRAGGVRRHDRGRAGHGVPLTA